MPHLCCSLRRSTSAETSHVRPLLVPQGLTASGLNVNPMTLHSYENYAFYRYSCPSRHRPLSNPDHITFYTLHIFPHPHNSPFSVTQQPELYTNALNCLVENPEQPNVEWPVPVSSDKRTSSDDPELESEPDDSRTPFPQFRIRWRRTICWGSWRRLVIHSPPGSWRKHLLSAFILHDADVIRRSDGSPRPTKRQFNRLQGRKGNRFANTLTLS